MLLRQENGNIIEINRLDFLNDELFYKEILENKFHFTKLDTPEISTNYTAKRISNFLEEAFQNKK
jgi:hypothetical protein